MESRRAFFVAHVEKKRSFQKGASKRCLDDIMVIKQRGGRAFQGNFSLLVAILNFLDRFWMAQREISTETKESCW